MHICKPLIAKVPLFNDVSVGCMELIVMHLRPDVYLAGEAIIKQGTYAYEMFFLNKAIFCPELPESSTSVTVVIACLFLVSQHPKC